MFGGQFDDDSNEIGASGENITAELAGLSQYTRITENRI